MATRDKLRRTGISLALCVVAWAMGVAGAAARTERVVALDECDPPTFNAGVRPGTCVNVGGNITFDEALAALPAGHEDWLFLPAAARIKKGDAVKVTNQGGEIHTFTEVAAYGGGFIPLLNDPPGSPPVPECAGGFGNPAVASTRLIQGSSLTVDGLTEGVHRFECCIHPWMRMEIEVTGD